MMNFRQVASGLDPLVEQLLGQLADVPTASEEEESFPYPTDVIKFRKLTEWKANKDPKRIAVKDTYNIVFRYVTLALNNQTGMLILNENTRNRDEWTRPAGHIFRKTVMPLARAVFNAVEGEHIGHVIISRLPPGQEIGWHTDLPPSGIVPPGLPYWWRYQIPLQADEGVIYSCGDDEPEDLHMKPGNAYWLNTKQRHRIVNNSLRDRLNLMVEIRPMYEPPASVDS